MPATVLFERKKIFWGYLRGPFANEVFMTILICENFWPPKCQFDMSALTISAFSA